jgi:hypothetical protein
LKRILNMVVVAHLDGEALGFVGVTGAKQVKRQVLHLSLKNVLQQLNTALDQVGQSAATTEYIPW